MMKNPTKPSSAQILLFNAVLNSNLEQAKHAIAKGADVNAIAGDAFTVEQSQSYLFIASYRGDEAMVTLLLKKGAHVNHPTSDGSTALLAACQQGHIEIVRQLVKHKAKINFSDNDGETPLFVAAGFGNEEIVSLLLDHGAQINNPNLNERGATPLFIACQKGHFKVVELLLSRGAAVDQARKNDGLSPLQIAVLCGHVSIVKLLIKSKANLSHKNNNGLTALQLAQENGLETMRDLLTSAMPYQESFIANIDYVLFSWKKLFPIHSLESKYIAKVAASIKDISEADEVFKKISTILKDSTSPDYIQVKEKLNPMRKLIISHMNKYNTDKTNALKQSSATTSTIAPPAPPIVATSASEATTSYYTDSATSSLPNNLLWTNPVTTASEVATKQKENDVDEQAKKDSLNEFQK